MLVVKPSRELSKTQITKAMVPFRKIRRQELKRRKIPSETCLKKDQVTRKRVRLRVERDVNENVVEKIRSHKGAVARVRNKSFELVSV